MNEKSCERSVDRANLTQNRRRGKESIELMKYSIMNGQGVIRRVTYCWKGHS